MALREDYQDYVPNEAGKKYFIAEVGDGMSTITDATTYDQTGDTFSAGVINATNAQVNANTAKLETVATLDANGKVEAEQISSNCVIKDTSYTLTLSDAGKLISMNSTSATTLTIPASSSVDFPVGTEIEVIRWNSGAVTIAGASTVTLFSVDSMKNISDRYGCVCLKKLSSDGWLLAGALA